MELEKEPMFYVKVTWDANEDHVLQTYDKSVDTTKVEEVAREFPSLEDRIINYVDDNVYPIPCISENIFCEVINCCKYRVDPSLRQHPRLFLMQDMSTNLILLRSLISFRQHSTLRSRV